MDIPDIITIILIVVAVVAIILVIIQLFLVRSALADQQSDVLKRVAEAHDSVVHAMDDVPVLNVYALVVDTVMTQNLDPKLKYFDVILPMLVPRQFSVPYICDGKVVSAPTDVYQVGVLAVRSNEASHRLLNDTINQRVQYVYLQKQPFFIAPVEEDVIKKLKAATDTDAFRGLDGRTLFALYAIQSSSNVTTVSSTGCQVATSSPFTSGKPSAFTGQNGIRLVSELGLQKDEEPLHVLAYKV